MTKELEKIRDNFIETVGELSKTLGLSRVVGQIYALLYLNDQPCSLDYIMDKLKISKGNVSMNIRALLQWGAVRKVWVKGSRKDYYEANPDPLKVISNQLKIGLQKRLIEFITKLNENQQLLQNIQRNLAQEDKKIIQLYQEKFDKIKQLYSKVEKLLKLPFPL